MSNNIWMWDNLEKYLQGTSYAQEWTDSNMHERTAYLTQAWPITVTYAWDHGCIMSDHIRHVDCTDMTSGLLGWQCIGKDHRKTALGPLELILSVQLSHCPSSDRADLHDPCHFRWLTRCINRKKNRVVWFLMLRIRKEKKQIWMKWENFLVCTMLATCLHLIFSDSEWTFICSKFDKEVKRRKEMNKLCKST